MIETQPTETGPDLSVIICVLNGAHVIRQQLDALRAQRARIRWEVIVADNGSTDDTRDVVERIARDFPVPLRVIDASDKKGVGAARNRGAQESRARFIAFCDCDDQVAEGWVQAAHDGLLAHDVVAGLNRELREPFDPDAPVLNPECVVRGSFGNAVMGGNAAFRRDVFFAAGGFDTALPPYGIEDFELSIRLALRVGADVAAAPDMLMYFRPTSNKRVLLGKVYSASCGEVLVWHRHPELYQRLHRLPRLVTRAVTAAPRNAVLMSMRKKQTTQAAREVVTCWGNLFTEVKIRSGSLAVEPPELLAPLH